MKHFERIRQHIVSNGIVLKHVADKSGIPQKKFYRLLNGKTDMTVEDFEQICRNGLSIDPSYFFSKKFSINENISA